ncbi:MAG: hypothetical protein AAGP08_07575 [Pseudomonadota bacterium]
MLNDIKSLIARSGPMLVQDLAGASLLVAVMAVCLHLPFTN